MDIWTQKKRSEVMSKIRSINTGPEKKLRSLLHSAGFRFRLHRRDLPGKPDIVLPRHRTVIFVHGCFWHYHAGCNEGRVPHTNSKFWNEKLSKNVDRDLKHQQALSAAGWQVLVVWECQLGNRARQEATLHNIEVILKSNDNAR